MAAPLLLPAEPEAATALLKDALAHLSEGGPAPREAVLSVFRRHLARVQHHVQEAFEAGGMSGLKAGRLLGRLMDGVVAQLHAHTLAEAVPGPPAEPLAVVATGGYGRGVLAPFSDIDLLFVTRDEPSPRALAAIEFILYFMWDLGLKVGHATLGSSASTSISVSTFMKRTAFAGEVEMRCSSLNQRCCSREASGMKCDVKNWRNAGFSPPQPISMSFSISSALSRCPSLAERRARPRA